jgi:extracellular matrix protein 14
MAKTLTLFVFLLAALSAVQAIPASGPVQLALHDKPTTQHTAPSSPFKRLRDAIIERIWDVPKKSRAKQCMNIKSLAPANYRARYGADVVLRFLFQTEEEVLALSEAVEILYLDVWEITDEWVDIRVAKDVMPSLLGLLPDTLQAAHTPIMHDLAQAVYDTYPAPPDADEVKTWSSLTSPQQQRLEAVGPHDLFFEEYQPLSVLYPWLRLMASMFPTHASLESIGLSAEGRDIPALRIGARTDLPPDHNHPTRQTILVVGGSHAREWVSVSTAAYIAYSLITRYGDPRFPETTKLLEHFDVTFLPTINPDGYEYTWTTDRLWRKNRQETPLPFCAGIDIDRSFPFGWDGGDDLDNPCSEDFAGKEPLAATEARQFTEWAKTQTESKNVTFVSFLDLHSYSQKVLYPYSYTCDTDPPNLEDLEEVAIGIAKSFRLTNGHYYGVNSACEGSISLDGKRVPDRKVKFPRGLVELQGGSALDYFYHELRVKYSYQIKLRDTGSYGFLLPREHIVPTGNEALEAVLGLGRWLLGNHGIEKFNEEL